MYQVKPFSFNLWPLIQQIYTLWQSNWSISAWDQNNKRGPAEPQLWKMFRLMVINKNNKGINKSKSRWIGGVPVNTFLLTEWQHGVMVVPEGKGKRCGIRQPNREWLTLLSLMVSLWLSDPTPFLYVGIFLTSLSTPSITTQPCGTQYHPVNMRMWPFQIPWQLI